jgi:hypothetical protein
MLQCDGLARCGAEVILYANRSVRENMIVTEALKSAYGIDAGRFVLRTFWSSSKRGVNLKIALLSFFHLVRVSKREAVLSRNLYAAFFLGVILRRPMIYETHQLEFGIRKLLQKMAIGRPWITTVVISRKMLEHLSSHHHKEPVRSLVLHDAAKEGIVPIKKELRRSTLENLVHKNSGSWRGVCGYFGHLYTGRGIEVIKSLAERHTNVLFLVFGGNQEDLEKHIAENTHVNLCFYGHVPHATAMGIMKCVDVLLMPYQTMVSIGIDRHDTARWMSPMKMFEYLASGVPVISSDLPVLREVLHDGKNALLVPPDDMDAWSKALDRLLNDDELAESLGVQGHLDYQTNHTWTLRARKLIDTFQGMM